MKKAMLLFCLAVTAALSAPTAPHAQGQTEGGQPAGLSRGQRDLGVVLLGDFAVKEGKLSFTAASGGCTTKDDFRVNVNPLKGSGGVPHYLLTVERIKTDDCKAFLPEGTTIAFDLEKDLGLKGGYTFAIANPMAARGKAPRNADDVGLEKNLIDATLTAVDLEGKSYRDRLAVAEAGTGPGENVERFKARIAALEADRERFLKMDPGEYPAVGETEDEGGGIFAGPDQVGPVVPAVKRMIHVLVGNGYAPGSLLDVEGGSRSGPFYRLAGIEGGSPGALKKDRRYELTVYLVFRREYFGLIKDYYVYVAGFREEAKTGGTK